MPRVACLWASAQCASAERWGGPYFLTRTNGTHSSPWAAGAETIGWSNVGSLRSGPRPWHCVDSGCARPRSSVVHVRVIMTIIK